jgi:hypothetical protein
MTSQYLEGVSPALSQDMCIACKDSERRQRIMKMTAAMLPKFEPIISRIHVDSVFAALTFPVRRIRGVL